MDKESLIKKANQRKKLLIEKIKRNKKLQKILKNKDKLILGLGVLGATSFVGLGMRSNEYKNYSLPDIKIGATVNTIPVNGVSVPIEEFYKNIKYNIFAKEWIYKDAYKLSEIIDNNSLNKKYYEEAKGKEIKLKFDNIPVSFKTDTIITHDTLFYIPKGSIICKTKPDTVNLHPVFGKFQLIKNDTLFMYPEKDILSVKADTAYRELILGKNKGRALTDSTIMKAYYTNYEIVINNFVSDTTLSKEEQEKAKARFHRKFNMPIDSIEFYDPKTEQGDPYKNYDHEEGHGDNDKDMIKSYGLAIEHTYKLAIHDEIKANIKQLIAQRKEYLKTGRIDDLKFPFYKNAVKKGDIKPASEKIPDEEKAFIGKEMLKSWEKSSKELYRRQIRSVTKRITGSSIWDDISNSGSLYENILKRVYNIKTSDNGDREDFFGFIPEIELDKKDRGTIEELKKERGVNYGDEFARIEREYGKGTLLAYIMQEKKKLEDKENEGKETALFYPNREAYIREEEMKRTALLNKKNQRN